MPGKRPETIDDYLAALPPPQAAALQTLREPVTLGLVPRVRRAAPDAEECISYGAPAFRQKKMLVAFKAAKKMVCRCTPGTARRSRPWAMR